MRNLLIIFLICYSIELNAQDYIVNYGDKKFMTIEKLPSEFKQTYSLKKRLPDGNWKVIIEKDSIVFTKGQYLSKRKNGVWKYYDEKGILWKLENFRKGKLVETTKLYYQNGNVSHKIIYESEEVIKIEYYGQNSELKKTEFRKNNETNQN
ncbi:hypothetical protein [Psychroserpens algicola]|uniref:hypothetical protein n=1 Tax=Psychroserpens algicola TaxID=1719034 RepID=UPI0019539604|nr:hypothetical protein [Psychroserpens algicola]